MQDPRIWKILFCTDCGEPTPPAEIERYGTSLLCRECETDLLTNPERFDLPPTCVA